MSSEYGTKPALLPPIRPGEILREEFLLPFGLSIDQLARDPSVPMTRISEIVGEAEGITADTAERLAQYFGTTQQFWTNLQSAYEVEVAER